MCHFFQVLVEGIYYDRNYNKTFIVPISTCTSEIIRLTRGAQIMQNIGRVNTVSTIDVERKEKTDLLI